MALLGWAGALAIGLTLGLLGSGGSILTVPILVYVLGEPDKVAIAESLAIVCGISLLASLPHAARGRVHLRSVLFFGLPGMAGTWTGAWLARPVPGAFQLAVFALVMLAAAVAMLRRRPVPLDAPPRRAFWKIALEGLGVGAMTGFAGVGGGFLIVPALVLLGGLPMGRAVGTSLVVIAMNSASGFYKYLDVLPESPDWKLIGVFVGLGGLGALLGSFLGTRVPQDRLRRAFGFLLLAVALLILADKLSGSSPRPIRRQASFSRSRVAKTVWQRAQISPSGSGRSTPRSRASILARRRSMQSWLRGWSGPERCGRERSISLRSFRRARCTRVFTVSSLIPRTAATSASGSSTMSLSTRGSRNSSGSPARPASTTSWASCRRRSSSGEGISTNVPSPSGSSSSRGSRRRGSPDFFRCCRRQARTAIV